MLEMCSPVGPNFSMRVDMGVSEENIDWFWSIICNRQNDSTRIKRLTCKYVIVIEQAIGVKEMFLIVSNIASRTHHYTLIGMPSYT